MKRNTLYTTVKTKTREHLESGSDVIESMDEVTRMSLSTMIGISGLIGSWAVACLIGAVVQLGSGPLQLSQNWFSAITGL